MKHILVLCSMVMICVCMVPMSHAHESWISITEPAPGIYLFGEKIVSLQNVIVIIGGDTITLHADGSNNIVSVYFTMNNALNQENVDSYLDIIGNDGWSCTFQLSKGLYVIGAIGAALDIEEPIAVDWISVLVL